MRTAMVSAAVIAGVIPALVGCATRDSVRTVENKLGRQIAGVEGRAETLEQKITSTAESVRDARSRADAAFLRANEVDSRLTRLWNNRHKRGLAETVEIHFAFDRADLDDAAETALASLVKDLQGDPRLGVELEGYADPRGPVAYNLELSRRRAETVRRYLVQRGIELPRIHWIGLGPVMDKGMDNASKRRVTLRVTVDAD